MTTRAKAFNAKIDSLEDYHSRIVNNVTPQPSGVDIANTLKYFSQNLLNVLKDVPIIPQESYGPRQRDDLRLTVFPNLDYAGVYNAVMKIIEIVPHVQFGKHALGESVLAVLGCLVPFLEYDLLDHLPYTVTMTLATFPDTLQRDIIQLLCTNLLPTTLGYEGMNDNPTYATESVSSVLMMVFLYVENGQYHSQVLECLLSFKKNIVKDLLSVIAYGPPQAKAPAVHHLFHYWPQLNPAVSDRRGIHSKYTAFEFIAWETELCQREDCQNKGQSKAVKMCLDPAISIECGDRPPPIFICADCVNFVRRDHIQLLVDVLQPLEHVPIKCENKNCTAPKNDSICTCFSLECASVNRFRPLRYCATCHKLKHGRGSSGENHIFHLTIPASCWSSNPELQGYLTEAIISLLKEAQPMEAKRTVEMGEERGRHQFDDEPDEDGEESDERKLLSRYGIWLMVELCKPRDDTPIEVLGRLIAMLFQWFDATAYLPDDNIGNSLERLKPEYIYKWLHDVSKTHLEVILSCLLPHPVEYARVGGHWDTLSSRTSQIKEGLNRLCCLIPYDIITFEAWHYIMPYWLEAIRTEVPEAERRELKVLLCKVFDTGMSPLPFDGRKMYSFVSERFENTTPSVQEQNLAWLQILTSLEIVVPLNILLEMFKHGVASMAKPATPEPLVIEDPPSVAPSPILHSLLDDLPMGSPMTPPPNTGNNSGARVFTFDHVHTDEPVNNITCFIIMLDLILAQSKCELQEFKPNMGMYNDLSRDIMSLLATMLNTEWHCTHTCSTNDSDKKRCNGCDITAQWYELGSKVMAFVAPKYEIKIPEKDLPKVEEIQQRPRMTNQSRRNGNKKTDPDETPDPVFQIDILPPQLRLLDSLLREISEVQDTDAKFFLLSTLKLLCLHAECLNYSIREHEEFVKHLLKSKMIPLLWQLLDASHSNLATMCVPLLLHCVTLPTGPDIFWHQIETDFNSDDWRNRFSAVEKVTVISRLIEAHSIKVNQQLMTSLSHCFCCLIGSLNDINSSVVQRTTMYLETIKATSLKCICHCLEFQFDSVINDRTMILQKVFLLSVVLPEKHIFSWEFFLNRFDTLCLEAQLDLESSGDISQSGLTDLHSSDRHSDSFLKKLNRARFALARTDSIRSVSYSVYAKVPYRRAASVPMHLLTKSLPTAAQIKEKDKNPYHRQQSAPQIRGRGSRFGLSMFSNYMFPGGHLREFTDEESNFAALLQRAMDLEGVDRETVHHLVSLLMKFMVQSVQDIVNEDPGMSRAQNIVLRHLNVLLGYNQTADMAFSVPPYKIRYSAVFSAYLSGLPFVLDKNFQLGNIILPVSMALLQYSPSPQRYATDNQPPNYSLWFLDNNCRQSWLHALLVILYKYQYNSCKASSIIERLIRITINTVDAQLHRCNVNDDTFGPTSPFVPRTRDTSNVSLGDLENIVEAETPPQSPTQQTVIEEGSENGDMVTFNMAPSPTSSSVHYRRAETHGEAGMDSMSSMSRVTSHMYKGSPPRPTSPTALSQPLRRHRSPGPLINSPTELLAQQQREQPRRIAEYERNSWSESEDGVDGNDIKPADMQFGRKFITRNIKQNVASKFPLKQRSLQESVEQYQMSLMAGKDRVLPATTVITDRPTTLTKPTAPQEVDLKIEEQLLAFESVVKKPTETGPAVTIPAPKAKVADIWNTGNGGGVAALEQLSGSFEKKFEPLAKPISTVLEEVSECEEEWESPKRLSKENTPAVGASEKDDKSYDGDSGDRGDDDKMGDNKSDTNVLTTESELDDSPGRSPSPEPQIKPVYRQKKVRKTGLTTIELQKMIPELADLSERRSPTSSRRARRNEMMNKNQPSGQKKSANAMRYNEQMLVDRCNECHAMLEQYDEETISLSIVCLSTFIHREPTMAAPLLLDMLQAVARIAASNPYPWQSDISGLIIPGNCVSVARQFLRCVLHQLAPNGIFLQLFQTELEDPDFLKTVAIALADFSDLNCYIALQLLLEGFNETKIMPLESVMRVIKNLSQFMDYMALDTSGPSWSSILVLFESMFRRIVATYALSPQSDMDPFMKIIIAVLKIPGIHAVKSILEPFSKLVSFSIQNCTIKLSQLVEICSLCSRAFIKERDKVMLCRSTVFELVQALKFKTSLPDENLLLLLQFVCIDAGGTLGPIPFVEELAGQNVLTAPNNMVTTGAAECMKHHLSECVEFVQDLHTINKVKNNMKSGGYNLNEDTLGSHIKAGIAQYVALEFTRGNGRDNRAINRYLPWLYHPPSSMQQGPREFVDCVGHIRLLSWLLMGSLTHTSITKASSLIVCQPLPLEASTYISDHIMVILTGFAEQSKASVLHMSSLFHAFILCQLWTMYCECYAAQNTPDSETYSTALTTIMDFWGRVTPGVLQLLSHSQVLSEMVNLHFLNMMEALQECNSTVLSKLFPMWIPILHSYSNQLPGHMQVRLQMCQNWEPKEVRTDSLYSDTLLKWLKRLQFKLGQIEVQSSQATQFYTV